MADLKISQLPNASAPLAGTEVLPIVQAGVTDKVTVDNLTAGRSVSAASVVVTGSTAPANGLYLPAANTVGWATNSVQNMAIDASGNVTLGGTTAAPALTVAPVASQTRWVTIGGSNAGNPTIGTSAGKLNCTTSLAVTGGASTAGDVALTRVQGWNSGGGTPTVGISMVDATQAANGRVVELSYGAANFNLRYINDAYSAAANIFNTSGTSAGVTGMFLCQAAGGTYTLVLTPVASQTRGLIVTGGTASTNTTLSVTSGNLAISNITNLNSATATPAAGSASAFTQLGTTAGFGIYYGSGAPTVTAAQGSLYLRSDGSTTTSRMYVNTNGSTTWAAVTTSA